MQSRCTAWSLVVLGAAAVIACTTDYQRGADDPKYGAPNALAGGRQPGPTSENVTDGGASAGGALSPACEKAGGKLADVGACSISFKDNILPAFKAASCQTVGTCHGGTNPANQPRINPDDPAATWLELTNFTLSNGVIYVNPCSTDAAESAIACNVDIGGACGTLMPPSVGLPTTVVADLKTWLQCGAPNN